MRTRTALLFAVTGVLFLAVTPALAASDAQACTDAGGTYTKDGGVATCSFPVGNSDNTKDTSQQGSFQSSHPEEKTNPGGNKPPGQQGGDTLR